MMWILPAVFVSLGVPMLVAPGFWLLFDPRSSEMSEPAREGAAGKARILGALMLLTAAILAGLILFGVLQ